jgi:hypothetical protein
VPRIVGVFPKQVGDEHQVVHVVGSKQRGRGLHLHLATLFAASEVIALLAHTLERLSMVYIPY